MGVLELPLEFAFFHYIPKSLGQQSLLLAPLADASVTSRTPYGVRVSDISGGRARFGPFKTISDFHRYLRRGAEARLKYVRSNAQK